jgi:DNA-binding NarL/FixJ family response regulator
MPKAKPEGYVRLFVDEGPPMAALLRRVGAGGAATGYVAVLLASLAGADHPGAGMASAPHPFPAAGHHAASLVEPLSGRELGVLRLLAAGLTNQEIAPGLKAAAWVFGRGQPPIRRGG